MPFNMYKKYCWIALPPIIAFLVGCSDLVVNAPTHNDNTADFERAWSITDSVYPYFQFKHINWDSIYVVYKPQAEDAKGDQIFQVLFNMLAELKDGHVEVDTKGGFPVRTYTPLRTERDRGTFDPLVVRKYFTEELSLAGGDRMEYGILPGNIGYVRIATFEQGSWILDFDNIISYLRDTNGLILDVRDNGGGSDATGTFVIRRFLSSPLPWPPIYSNGVLKSNPPLQPSGALTFSKPVVVLMNGTCFSATEDFLNMIGQLPNVTLLGDTSAGGSGAPQDFFLPSGRRIRVSTLDFRRYDGRPIEWNGIVPDVLVMQTEADIKSDHDLQLERAIALLK